MSDLKVYLAARYSRRAELCEYRTDLSWHGIEVTGRWLNGGHQVDDAGQKIGEAGEALVEEGSPLAAKFAQDDVEDVAAASIVVAFTEPPRASSSRGGRHVELGLAIAWAKRIIVVGPRENVFCWLPYVEHVAHFSQAEALLVAEVSREAVAGRGDTP